ncbi:TIGR03943 family protein [Paenibacillus sp. NEAU-GSW1]|uniref:TIGR03943 family putative permease subunit n=1 Tax=Paenibacillus sp. NEAU-GSW1 TaxID=2682486 RepID=UPI0012E17CF4|nr:TIGR03943 family protein [Paenibacillus sp. NEAU-GSW1]MUT66872.1 TIGR03943 family protein [Paenibacillus sp. NEAU-GSW1]
MQNKAVLFHYLFRSAILACLSFFIVGLVQQGRLSYYIAPRTELYVKLAALGLFFLAVCLAYIAIQNVYSQAAACGCKHPPPSSIGKSILLYSLFVFPLLLGFFTPDTLLGSNISALKGVNLNIGGNTSPSVPITITIDSKPPSAQKNSEEPEEAEAATDTDPLSALFPHDEYTELHAKLGKKLYSQNIIAVNDIGFMETLTTLDIYRNNFIGKTIQISGFVYQEEDMKPGQFIVSRLAMQCCSADTEPYGILAVTNDGTALAEDTWVRVTGVLGETMYRDNKIMELSVQHIETIPAPESAYVYPDDAYFEQLLTDS